MTGARDEVLGRIRTALGPDRRPAPEVHRHYRRSDGRPVAELLDVLTDRLEDYAATVLRCSPEAVGATVAAALDAGLGVGWAPAGVVVAPGLPAAWRPDGVSEDDGRPAVGLTAFAATVTGVAVAVAETGTLVLDGGARSGRRALSLLPDCLVCVVETGQVVGGVPEALARLDATAPLTMVSGPSATSDIELSRVEGVHGPRTLVVVLMG
ncbi:LutC/YkgG family protein [Geodermatophilus sabuli]|uniref:L-lactate dehydrogenase complex protein LldG n=1 Tax=Geodermatophilus sabuli TaxID=1564158 RepID=A0A285EMU5_9ACTN|nr:LUD domain-containing protein [Geodermatophilus sabuli]MBB3083798.1 L-lactate dehydrogenase complex protein LldG [Geodermatophilus sabuli]SNX99311.1 L-lactate dehydrogenase complex protein LldG [Geodermatophilus sabuli]